MRDCDCAERRFARVLAWPQLEELVASTADLKARQEAADPPEALKCIPTLKLSDIPKEITKVRPGPPLCSTRRPLASPRRFPRAGHPQGA